MNLGETIVSVGVILMMSVGMTWQGNRIDKLKASNSELTAQLSEQVKINEKYQARITKLNELDTKHTTELTNAKAEIDRLRVSAERNPDRVYIKAECTSTASMDDATIARPTDTAIRNYWLLRERIAHSEQMILGLQDYIRQECVN
ncbi:lysis protein [Proteus mirabilis]|uniref:lysis protein n=1 Tax=Proteus mirabilis TaxID=584 RepID=UPI000B4A4535|nr:lysis protein [Proteus mirabilis]EHZ6870904.1 lysis protein [Providencia rettgeri]MCK2325273.1 lysis protein [Escherichia coli]ASB03317.1 lysozyme [Proteus mirabilis]AWR58870.1 lysis protein [Proteus mirabilis]EIT1736842.1 lysis protein [Proteus mirabilis]